MKTKIFLSLTLMFMSFISFAQNIVENSFLRIIVPEGWEVQKVNMATANVQVVAFSNKGSVMYNTGMIIGLDKYVDPEMAIQAQITSDSNVLLKGSTFGEFYHSTFMGKPAQAVNYEKNVDGVKYKGTVYAFNENECTLLCLGMYDAARKSTLPQIWRSIRWKHFERNESVYANIREEVQAFINEMNPIWKASPFVTDGEQLVSMRIDDDPVCLVYVKKTLNFNVKSLPQDNMDIFTSAIKDNLIAQTRQNIDAGTTLVKNWVDAGYLIKYEFYDMNDHFICAIVIKPDDLQ